jgi:hypothetical protein
MRPDPDPVRMMLPLSLFVLVTESRACPLDPMSKSTGVVREIVKSPTLLTNVALWLRVPLLAKTSTVYAPGVVEVRVHVALTDAKLGTAILLGQFTARPVLGEVIVVMFTFPVNPNRDVIVIVDVP